MCRVLPLLAVLSIALAPVPVRTPKPGADAEDMKALQGTWLAEEGVGARFDGDSLAFDTRLGPGLSYWVTVDASARPKAIDLKAGRVYLGIYSLEKGVLKLCCQKTGKGRPASFPAKEGDCDLFLFTRPKP